MTGPVASPVEAPGSDAFAAALAGLYGDLNLSQGEKDFLRESGLI